MAARRAPPTTMVTVPATASAVSSAGTASSRRTPQRASAPPCGRAARGRLALAAHPRRNCRRRAVGARALQRRRAAEGGRRREHHRRRGSGHFCHGRRSTSSGSSAAPDAGQRRGSERCHILPSVKSGLLPTNRSVAFIRRSRSPQVWPGRAARTRMSRRISSVSTAKPSTIALKASSSAAPPSTHQSSIRAAAVRSPGARPARGTRAPATRASGACRRRSPPSSASGRTARLGSASGRRTCAANRRRRRRASPSPEARRAAAAAARARPSARAARRRTRSRARAPRARGGAARAARRAAASRCACTRARRGRASPGSAPAACAASAPARARCAPAKRGRRAARQSPGSSCGRPPPRAARRLADGLAARCAAAAPRRNAIIAGLARAPSIERLGPRSTPSTPCIEPTLPEDDGEATARHRVALGSAPTPLTFTAHTADLALRDALAYHGATTHGARAPAERRRRPDRRPRPRARAGVRGARRGRRRAGEAAVARPLVRHWARQLLVHGAGDLGRRPPRRALPRCARASAGVHAVAVRCPLRPLPHRRPSRSARSSAPPAAAAPFRTLRGSRWATAPPPSRAAPRRTAAPAAPRPGFKLRAHCRDAGEPAAGGIVLHRFGKWHSPRSDARRVLQGEARELRAQPPPTAAPPRARRRSSASTARRGATTSTPSAPASPPAR